MNPVKKIFKNLPKRLEWKNFYVNDLPIIMEICEDIRQISPGSLKKIRKEIWQ